MSDLADEYNQLNEKIEGLELKVKNLSKHWDEWLKSGDIMLSSDFIDTLDELLNPKEK